MHLPCSTLLASLTPDFVSVAESDTPAITGRVWPEEEAQIVSAAPGRQAEFRAGRVLARRAMARLGTTAAPIPRGRDRAPIWPTGLTGSISHCRRHLAAVVARTTNVAAIGVDIEEITRFRPDLERGFLSAREAVAAMNGHPREQARANAAAMFCVKEAFYKCQSPLTSAWLGFHDVEVTLLETLGACEIRLLVPTPPGLSSAVFAGRYGFNDGLAAAVVWLPGPDRL